MGRLGVLALFLVVAGCQGNDTAYDSTAKAKARALAPRIASYGTFVSVGRAVERRECAEAQPFVAGPCVDIVVARRIPGIDQRGKAVTVIDRTHVFAWLERRKGHWVVTHSAQWNPDLVLTIRSSYPPRAGERFKPPPSWMYGGYQAREPLPGG